ncbi:hypothetical protein BGX29_010240 [Mortierella sp. GBA35]|nr:hypothetical protein BGX29_010240 [Mortierella sp. GBA35]
MYNHIGFSALPSKALERTYKSLDESCFGKNWIVSDFMSKPPPPGAHTPARTLKLKVGLPIMLLSDVMGLSAGTRVLIVGLEDDVIHASATITNDSVGLSTSENRVVQIYRNEFIDSTRCGPVVSYYRRQFPVKRAVALTIDDLPEGVMFKGGVGVDLTYPFKSPGQLHSALSRSHPGGGQETTLHGTSQPVHEADYWKFGDLVDAHWLNPPGIPPSNLTLRIGHPVILLHPTRQIPMGTRMIVRRFVDLRTIECEVCLGPFMGQVVQVHKRTMTAPDGRENVMSWG